MQNSFRYTEGIEKHFRPFADHPCCGNLPGKWKEKGFCFHRPLEYALSQKKDDFAALFACFAAESDLEGFYRSEEGFYERTLRVNIEKVRNVCYPDMPRESYKKEGFRCCVCLMPTGGSRGSQVTCRMDEFVFPAV